MVLYFIALCNEMFSLIETLKKMVKVRDETKRERERISLVKHVKKCSEKKYN